MAQAKRFKRIGDSERLIRQRLARDTVAVSNTESHRRLSVHSQTKGFQFHPAFLPVLEKYPELINDFLRLRIDVRRTGEPAQNRQMRIELFDPHDGSSQHSQLYRVALKHQSFFVKEVRDPTYPIDAATQFAVHDRLVVLNHQLNAWNARVVPYIVGWRSKTESFLVSEWISGTPLHQWIESGRNPKIDDVYQRYLRVERLLKRNGAKDMTMRNVLYNPKTDELLVVDLLPQDG